MIVGFWNIQRASSLESRNENAQLRAWLAYWYIHDWITGQRGASGPPPDILFLAEVTSTGEAFAAYLSGQGGLGGLGYQARFFPVPNVVGHVSPCSFIVVARHGIPLHQVEVVGGSIRRPAIIVPVGGGCRVVGAHVVANRRRSLDEVLDICNELGTNGPPVFVIGDMNYDYAKLGPYDLAYFTQIKYTPRDCIPQTFRTGGALDWGVGRDCRPTPAAPYNNYSDYSVIDHAPIAFAV